MEDDMSSGRIVDAGEFSSATLNRRMMLDRIDVPSLPVS
jgi:hypothetical protein